VNIYDAAFAMIDALDRAGIQYSLVGSLTAMYYGIARSTMDADFVVQLAGQQILEVRNHLPSSFSLEDQPRFELLTGRTYYVVAIHGTPFNIDLFTLSGDAFDQSSFSRRRKIHILDHEIMAPSPEDVVVQKLRWQRPQDVIDAQHVIAVQRDVLDWSYIEHWCEAHATKALLDKVRSEIP
jgi:hypothetical protein